MNEETYLGDGLYASFDGFNFILRAPRGHGDHFVALEPSVLRAFEQFVKRTKEHNLADGERGENPEVTDHCKSRGITPSAFF